MLKNEYALLPPEHKRNTIPESEEEEGNVLPNEQEGNDASTVGDDSRNRQSELRRKAATKARYSAAAGEGMRSYASLVYANEDGVAPFYSGVVTSAVQSATEKALYFFAYTFLKNG